MRRANRLRQCAAHLVRHVEDKVLALQTENGTIAQAEEKRGERSQKDPTTRKQARAARTMTARPIRPMSALHADADAELASCAGVGRERSCLMRLGLPWKPAPRRKPPEAAQGLAGHSKATRHPSEYQRRPQRHTRRRADRLGSLTRSRPMERSELQTP